MTPPPLYLTAAEMAATPHDLNVANDAHDSARVTVRETGAVYRWSIPEARWCCCMIRVAFDPEFEMRFDYKNPLAQ